MPLRWPSADTGPLVQAALRDLNNIFVAGYRYAKAGVTLLDQQTDHQRQGELDLEEDWIKDRTQLMLAMDTLNRRIGKGKVHLASAGLTVRQRTCSMRQ